MEYIISPVWVALELLSVLLFSAAFLPVRYSKAKIIISFSIVWVTNSLSAMFIPSLSIHQLITVTTTFAVVFMCFRGSVLRKIICVLLAITFIGVVDMICAYSSCAVMGINNAELESRKLLYVLVFTVSKLICLFAAHLFQRFRKTREIQQVQRRWLLLTLLFPALSLIMIFGFFAFFVSSEDIPLGSFIFITVIAIANVAILYLVEIMEKRTKEENQLVLLNQQMHVQTNSIHALEKSYRSQREASHEFMRHLQTLSDLLDTGMVNDAHRYIHDLQELQTERIFAVNSHHPILDAVFNQTSHSALEQNTDVVFEVNDLSRLTIKSNALVVIFGNLLDNALEACQKVSTNRQVYCSALMEDSFFISIRNTSPPVTVTKEGIHTTKINNHEHGYGLPNVCRILDQLEAEYAYDYHDGWFHFVAEIPIN